MPHVAPPMPYCRMRAGDPIPVLKRQLADVVVERLEGWTQVYAADFLGTDQPRMSDLRARRLDRFSLEQLVRFVARVYGDVTLYVEWGARRRWLFRTLPLSVAATRPAAPPPGSPAPAPDRTR